MNKNTQGPWGKAPSSSPQKPPFSLKDFLNTVGLGNTPGRRGGKNGTLFIALLVLGVLIVASGLYRIEPSEQGVVMRFGKAVRTEGPGLGWHLPWPIETIYIRNVTKVYETKSGIPLEGLRTRIYGVDEHSMLTGDENIVEVNFTILWSIKDVKDFLFNVRGPEETVKTAGESVVREIVAQTPIAPILAEGRSIINYSAQKHLQALVDQYGLGISIQAVMMGVINPPTKVIDAYRDVQRARADQERAINDAEAMQNAYIPRKRAEAARMLCEAEGQAALVVAKAESRTAPFKSLLPGWRTNKKVVEERMKIQTFSEIFSNQNKIVIGSDKVKTSPILPLLNQQLFENVGSVSDSGNCPPEEGADEPNATQGTRKLQSETEGV